MPKSCWIRRKSLRSDRSSTAHECGCVHLMRSRPSARFGSGSIITLSRPYCLHLSLASIHLDHVWQYKAHASTSASVNTRILRSVGTVSFHFLVATGSSSMDGGGSSLSSSSGVGSFAGRAVFDGLPRMYLRIDGSGAGPRFPTNHSFGLSHWSTTARATASVMRGGTLIPIMYFPILSSFAT